MIYELQLQKITVEAQKNLPIFYKDIMLDSGYRADLIVENKIIIELKSVAELAPIHEAQLLSYLKHSDCQLGLLINFNVQILRDGIRRFKV